MFSLHFSIQRFLKDAVVKKCNYALIEVTSQGVLQYRHRFIDFDACLLTNLEPEHIEAHGSFENYRDAKVKFFKDSADFSSKQNKIFIINENAREKEYFMEAVKNKGEQVFFNKNEAINSGINSKLIGDFNMENIAAAVAFARSQNINWEVIKKTIENFEGVPGRLEFIQREPFSIVVDYAHTPDSLEKVYKALNGSPSTSLGTSTQIRPRLICVLGAAGGGRDKWKRPVMGKIASEYCNQIILTDEDPFDENPDQILSEIESGATSVKSKATSIKKILDRKEAIRTAIKDAKAGDTVVITGKGSELYMRVADNKKIPWSDKKIVLDVLKNLK